MEVIYRTGLPPKEELYELYEHLGWNSFLNLSLEQLLQAMAGSTYSIYAYSGKSLIATGRIISDGITNAYLCGLGVHKQHRHKGIATNIIERLRDYCQENNLHLQFFCEEPLVPLYEKLGFEKFAVGMKLQGS